MNQLQWYRRRYWIALFLGILAAIALFFTSSDPSFSEPCHGFATGDPQRMVISWQVTHPISAGVLSGFTFGLWPAHGIYAPPSACTYRDYGRGLPMYYYNVIRADAYPTFLWSRTLAGGLLVALLSIWLLGLFLRPLHSPAAP